MKPARPALKTQRRIDTIALALVCGITLLLDLIGAMTISYLGRNILTTSVNAEDYAALAGLLSLVLLLPLWFFLALRIRRALGWPQHAFEPCE